MTAADMFIAFISIILLATAWALAAVVRAARDREVTKYRRIFAELRRVSTQALGTSDLPLIETIQQLVAQRNVQRRELLQVLIEARDPVSQQPLLSPYQIEKLAAVLFPDRPRSIIVNLDLENERWFSNALFQPLPEVQPSGEHTPPPVGE